jgi:hypothetical protein
MSRKRRVAGGGTRRGFVLISVLWITVVMVTIALTLARENQLQRRAASNIIADAQLDAAAAAGIIAGKTRLTYLLVGVERLGLGSETSAAADRWGATNGLPADTLELGRATAVALLTDASSRLNIIRADEADISRLLNVLGFQSIEQQAVLQALLVDRLAFYDRVSTAGQQMDEGPVVHGRDDVEEIGSTSNVGLAPRSAISLEMLQRLWPYLTIHGTGRINVKTAPRVVLAALPGFTSEVLEEVERARRNGTRLDRFDDLRQRLSFSDRATFDRLKPTLSTRLVFRTEEIEVRVDVRLANGMRRVTSALLRPGGRVVTAGEYSNE